MDRDQTSRGQGADADHRPADLMEECYGFSSAVVGRYDGRIEHTEVRKHRKSPQSESDKHDGDPTPSNDQSHPILRLGP
jgi:hypothetical protein